MENKLSFKQFIERFGTELVAQAEAALPPIVTQPLYRKSGRTPKGQQALASAGLLQRLQQGQAITYLPAEMSTGKSKIALDAVLAYQPQGRTLVLCPPHLVEKWKREAELEGARGIILNSPADVRALASMDGPLVAVLSREKAKLGSGWKPAVTWRRGLPTCPDCSRLVIDKDRLPLTQSALERKRYFCKCGSALWQQVAPARVPLADYLKRIIPKGFFKTMILDEAHEYKAGDSAQGIVAGSLGFWVGQVLALTGTLFGGYASNLFHLLWRYMPEFRAEYRHNEVARFVAEYGLLERVTREADYRDGRVSQRKERSSHTRERPGLSPLLLPWLLPASAFVRLTDVVEGLPPYEEQVQLLPMDELHQGQIKRFYDDLKEAVNAALVRGSRRLLGAYLQAGLSVPDAPWEPTEVVEPDTKRVVASYDPLPGEYQHAKERELLDLVCREQAGGRRVLVYVQNTRVRDQLSRLKIQLENQGLRVAVLRAETVPAARRETWLAQQVGQGVDVVLAHPRLVQTGLDLIDFPTLVFYQVEYSVYTLRQAARRSWRIGQTQPVRVVFMGYQQTLQAGAYSLIAAKARSSLALEGELVEGGLVAAAEEDPLLLLARSLISQTDLDWRGSHLGLEKLPDRPVELPLLATPRWVGAGRSRVLLPVGQPVLFA
jgi:superfamily II DNA or RNA helicase